MSSVKTPRVESESPTSWGSLKPVSEPVKPRGVPVLEPGMLSSDCIAADGLYSDGVAAWYAEAEKVEAAVTHRYDLADTVSLAELLKRRETIQTGELKLAQAARKLTRDYVDRETVRAAELRVVVESREEALATTVESVTKRLNETGISVESQPAYPANPEAAKITFSHLVKQSAEYRDAYQKLSEAQAAHDMTLRAISTGAAQAAEAKGYLATVVRRLAGC